MRSSFLLSLFLGISTLLLAQPTGKVIEQISLHSSVLGRNVNYAIYLPPDYDKSERAYPAVYLLHGYTDDHTSWLQLGEVNRYADKAIAEGTISPMIIIMPDGDTSWYINSYDGKEKYEDFFIQEFIPAMEKTYRIKSKRNFRAVAGLSMGGYGSLIYALKYPDYFAAAAPLSAGVFTDDEIVNMPDGEWNHVFGPLYGRGLKGKARLNKAWQDYSVLSIIAKKSTDDLSKVRYWIDCGDDDFLAKGNSFLHIALKEKKVAHEYRVRDGIHSWLYWRSGITDALEFISRSFR